jgi:hypothetical protein
MNNRYAVYDQTGAIRYVWDMTEATLAVQTVPAGMAVSAAFPHPFNHLREFSQQYYVAAGVVVPRSSMGLSVSKTSFTADGVDEVTIGGIPTGAVAQVSGAVTAGPETISDGSLTLTSTTTGSITVSISAPPTYFDWSVTLDAT